MEPGAVKNLQGLTRLPKPDYLNYVYSPHIYHTEMESGDGYKKEYLKYFKEQVAKDLVQAKDFDSGLFYGEWGAIGHRDQKKYNTFIKDLTALFDDHNIHWTIWESGSSIEKSKESFENSFWVRDLSRPYPAAWPFDNLKFSYDPEAKKIRISSKSLLNSVIPIAQIRLPSWVKSSKIIDKPSCLTSNRTINGDLFLEFNSKEWDKDLEIEFK